MKISSQDRRRVYEAHEEGSDWRNVAKTLGIKENTAYKWLSKKQVAAKKKGGSSSRKTQEIMDSFEDVIEENPSITLRELQQFLIQHFGLSVSISTIKNWLDLQLYSVKNVRSEIDRINNPVNKQKRSEYMEKFFAARSAGRTIIWIDETNYNLYCKRKEGRSKIGSRASVILPASKGANLHCIGGMTHSQMVHFTTHRGSFKGEDCKLWFRDLIQKCTESGIMQPTFIIDNAPVHSRLEELMAEFPHIDIIRLAPYSYLLNPIELVWSAFKSHIKRMMRNRMSDLLAIERSSELTMSEQRMRVLEGMAQEAISKVTSSMLMNFTNRVEKYYAAASRQEDLKEIP